MSRSIWIAGWIVALSGGLSAVEPPARPNIVLILADDLGYSDLGCYGGEIRTPQLDALAANGVRFTRFTNGSRCCPSRASLLTGLYPHQAGVGDMTNDKKTRGYRGHLVDECVTLAEVLKPVGYRTYLSGKWHLSEPGPIARGFDEGFVLNGGFQPFWDPKHFRRLPAGRPARTYPPGQFYATDAITDYALDFVAEARQVKQPYFLYLAYNAPHFPLHAPRAEIDRYADLYTRGWDAIRVERLARMTKLGLIRPDTPLPPRSGFDGYLDKGPHGVNPAWDTLEPDRRADLARRMAIYAAMVDRMDQNIGRVVADLRAHGELESTLILFLSDNGACAEWDPNGFDGRSGPDNVLHRDADLDAMGAAGSYISYGSGWANACNTPWRLYKHQAHEGGISTPLIVHWPKGMNRRDVIDDRPGHLIDVMPTLVEAAGTAYPKKHQGHTILPAEGRSLIPALRGQPDTPRALFYEHEGNRAVRDGRWKLVAVRGQPWELYDIEADRTESENHAAREPDQVARLARLWDEWAARCFVEIPRTPDKP